MDVPGAGVNAGVKNAMFSSAGAVIVGRRMFDLGFGPWGEEPPFHLPAFVLTHRLRDPMPMRGGTTYRFTSGLETTLEAAKEPVPLISRSESRGSVAASHDGEIGPSGRACNTSCRFDGGGGRARPGRLARRGRRP